MKSAKSKDPKKNFRFLWITDPWRTLDHPLDTSLRLAEEAVLLGHESWWCDVKSLRLEEGKALLNASRILRIRPGRHPDGFETSPSREFSPLDFDSIQYRVDPPVDLSYLQPLQVLRLALEKRPKSRPEIVNPVDALFLANEKLEGTLIAGLSPPCVVSSQWERLRKFGVNEGKTVLKPLHLAQSAGIELLNWNTKGAIEHARGRLEGATGGFERPVLLQRYLPEIAQGETRLWFLDGKILATLRKFPMKKDFRVDIDRGSELQAHTLTLDEKRAAIAIGKRLRRLQVRLAAVDLIAGYITDFNLTSPGLITQAERLTGRNLAKAIITALTRKT